MKAKDFIISVILVLCSISIIYSINAETLLASKRPVVIFQAVDMSFFAIWVNWWVIANTFNVIPQHWELHLACIGEEKLEELVKVFYEPGCTQIIPKALASKRIYFAKWKALTNALRLGKDLLLIDIDAILIRDPRPLLRIYNDEPSLYDIISSRDHGPSELPYADSWAMARFCTGFTYFKFSTKVLELVELSLARCDKYGHDQIQFNNALSRASLVFDASSKTVSHDLISHTAVIPWAHQTDPDFVLFNYPETHSFWKTQSYLKYKALVHALIDHKPMDRGVKLSIDSAQSQLIEKIDVLLLDRFSVLRYCNQPQVKRSDWVAYLKVANYTLPERLNISCLHCFVAHGPVGESGQAKKRVKSKVMEALNYWLLKYEYENTDDIIYDFLPQFVEPKYLKSEDFRLKKLGSKKTMTERDKFLSALEVLKKQDSLKDERLKNAENRKKKKNYQISQVNSTLMKHLPIHETKRNVSNDLSVDGSPRERQTVNDSISPFNRIRNGIMESWNSRKNNRRNKQRKKFPNLFNQEETENKPQSRHLRDNESSEVMSLPMHPMTGSRRYILDKIIDNELVEIVKSVWIDGDVSRHKNPYKDTPKEVIMA